MIEIIINAFRGNRLRPVAFHQYPSTVIDGIVSITDNDSKTVANALFELERKFIRLFTEVGIACGHDNKIVFECLIGTLKLYFGFKDGEFTVGLGLMKGR